MPDISPTDNTDLTDNTSVNDTGDLDNKGASDSTSQYSGTSNPSDEPINADQDQDQDATPNVSSQVPINTAQAPQTAQQTPQGQAQQAPQPAAQPAPAKPDLSDHPAVQRAGLLHTIAQTLAGGPRFQTTIDPNTGEMKHTAIPLSKADIGMALAAEAIQGSLAGLSVANGPGNLGRAAAAGGAATSQARQQVDKQQTQEANADFARKTQMFETNMRMHQNALMVGRQSLDSNIKYVGLFKPTIDDLEKNHPEVIKAVVDESELPKYNVTKDGAIPYSVVQRIDPTTGEQVKNSYGEPQWDIKYAIIDPEFQTSLKPEIVARAKELGLQGFGSDLPKDIPMRLRMEAGITSKIGGFDVFQDSLNSYYKELNGHAAATDAGRPNNSVFSMFNSNEDLADFIAKTEKGGKADARSVRNNNPGNLVADASWHGKIDDKNLPKGQTPFRVYDSPEEGRQGLLHQLSLDQSKMPNATPEKFFEKYDKNDAPAYAAAARKAAGFGNVLPEQNGNGGDKYTPVDLLAAQKKDPQLINALNKFNPLLEAAKGNYETAIGALGKQDSQAAGKMIQLLGGSDTIRAYDTKRTNDTLAATEATKAAARLKEQADSRQDKRNETDSDLEDIAKSIAGDPNDPGSGDMATLKMLISQRTADRPRVYAMAKKLNPNFNPAEAELKAETWDQFNKGKPGDAIRSGNTFLDHLGAAMDASNSLSRASGLGTAFQQPLIDVRQKYLGDAGNAAQLSQFETEIEPAATEFETLLSNNHALTETDKKNVARLRDPATSLEVKSATLRAMASTAAYRLKEYDNQYKKVFRTGVPGLITQDGANVLNKLYDENGYNKTADILKDADVGGTFMGSGTGRGTPGQPVSKVVPKSKQQTQTQVPTGKTPAWKDGKVIGYADDATGKNPVYF